jgi:hypothetical protein
MGNIDSAEVLTENALMKLQSISFCLAVILAVLAATCFGQWYLGGEAGYVRHTFGASYTFAVGESDAYTKAARGFEAGVVGGYTFGEQGPVSLSLQGRAARKRGTQQMSTGLKTGARMELMGEEQPEQIEAHRDDLGGSLFSHELAALPSMQDHIIGRHAG